jgi:hypothetical protein
VVAHVEDPPGPRSNRSLRPPLRTDPVRPTSEIEQDVGRALLAILDEQFSPCRPALDLQVTVEVQDIDPDARFESPREQPNRGAGRETPRPDPLD